MSNNCMSDLSASYFQYLLFVESWYVLRGVLLPVIYTELQRQLLESTGVAVLHSAQ